MKIQPVASPGQIPTNGTPEHVRTAKAVAAFNRGLSAETPAAPVAHAQPATQVVRNQNRISAEELGAVKTQSLQEDTDESLQTHTEVVDTSGDDTPGQEPAEVVETPAETVAEQDPALSRQFAQLARQEKALRASRAKQEAEVRAREAAIEAREAAIAAKEQEYKTGYIPKTQLKNNPMQALLEAEVSYDELTQQIMNQSNPLDPRIESHIAKLEAKIQSLEKTHEESQAAQKSSQQKAYDQAITQIRTDATNLVAKDPNFESIKATNSVNDVVDLIVRTYNEDGILLTVEEAAEEVENHIVEETFKLSRLSKVQKRLQSVVPQQSPKTTPPSTQTPKVQTAPTMKTLTNAAASTRPLTARERALLAFKGELK